jgi:hypothetical protein
MRLANARRSKAEDTTDDDVPSTSGRQFTEASVLKVAFVESWFRHIKCGMSLILFRNSLVSVLWKVLVKCVLL